MECEVTWNVGFNPQIQISIIHGHLRRPIIRNGHKFES